MVIHTCLRPRLQSVFEFMWNSFLTDFEIKQFSLFEYLMDRHLSWEHCLSFRLYIAFAANFCTRSIFLWFLNQHYIYTDLAWTGLDRPRFVSSCYLRLLLKDIFLWAMKRKGLHFNATRFLREHFSHIRQQASVLPSLFELNFNAGKTHIRAQAHCSPMNFTMFFCHTQHSCWKFDEWPQSDSLLDGNKQEIYLK